MLGYAHPDQLLEELTSRQISEWYAYDILEPIDDRLGWALLASVITNIAISLFSQGQVRYTSIQDFLISKEKKEKEQTVEEQKQILMNLVKLSEGK